MIIILLIVAVFLYFLLNVYVFNYVLYGLVNTFMTLSESALFFILFCIFGYCHFEYSRNKTVSFVTYPTPTAY
jgi:hypothetical protein